MIGPSTVKTHVSHILAKLMWPAGLRQWRWLCAANWWPDGLHTATENQALPRLMDTNTPVRRMWAGRVHIEWFYEHVYIADANPDERALCACCSWT